MSNEELDELARQIYLEYDSDDLPAARKLLRSIEIAALREVRELMQANFVQGIDYLRITHVRVEVIQELERKIRQLELKS